MSNDPLWGDTPQESRIPKAVEKKKYRSPLSEKRAYRMYWGGKNVDEEMPWLPEEDYEMALLEKGDVGDGQGSVRPYVIDLFSDWRDWGRQSQLAEYPRGVPMKQAISQPLSRESAFTYSNAEGVSPRMSWTMGILPDEDRWEEGVAGEVYPGLQMSTKEFKESPGKSYPYHDAMMEERVPGEVRLQMHTHPVEGLIYEDVLRSEQDEAITKRYDSKGEYVLSEDFWKELSKYSGEYDTESLKSVQLAYFPTSKSKQGTAWEMKSDFPPATDEDRLEHYLVTTDKKYITP